MQRSLLRAVAGEAADAGELFALEFTFLNFAFQYLGGLLVFVEINVERLLHELADKFLQAGTTRPYRRRAELRLRLRLEDRLHHAHRDRGVDRLPDVRRIVVLFEKIPDRIDECFAKRREVGAAHRRVLTVDERIIFLAVVRAVSDRDLDVFTFQMHDRIERLAAEIFLEQVLEAVFRTEGFSIQGEREPAIEEGVVPKHVLDEFEAEFEILSKEGFVGREFHERARAFVALHCLVVFLQFPLGKFHEFCLPIAKRLRAIFEGQRIDGFLPNAVQADRFLKRLAVIFRARVDDGDAVDEFPQRDAAAVIADAHRALVEHDLDPLARAHRKFVDAIIDRLLDEHVNAILGVRAIAEPPDIHPRTQADVLEGGERFDRCFGVSLSHGWKRQAEAGDAR